MNLEIDPQGFQRRYKHWAYKNTALLCISLAVFFYFTDSKFIQSFINGASDLGYLGAFITGIFFVSTFTVAPSAIILYKLADVLNPHEVALLAGLGAMLGDYFIFRFLRDKVFDELKPLVTEHGGMYLRKFFKTPYFAWLLPAIGAFIIATPLPDEAGISLLGLSKLKNWQFLLVSFLLNSAGILLVIILAQA